MSLTTWMKKRVSSHVPAEGRPQPSKPADSPPPVLQKCMACGQPFNALMHSCPHCGAAGSSVMSGGSELFDIFNRKEKATRLNDEAAQLYQQGKIEAAVGLLQKALEVNPLSEKAHENLAFVLLQERRFDEARTVLEKVLSFNPRREDARRYMARVKSQPKPARS